MPVRIPPEDEARILELYRSGFSLSEVSNMVHWSMSAVYRRLLANDVKIRPRGGTDRHPRCVPHDELAKTAFMYEKMYMSLSEIAEALGLKNHTTVHARCQKAGVKMRSPREAQLAKRRRLNGIT